MPGLLWWDETVRGVSAPERAEIAGLCVLRVRLAPGGRWEGRRAERAGRLLAKRGVRYVLPLRDFAWWDRLRRTGLAPVDPLPLYQTMAPQLTLALLARRGVAPRNACVLLRGEWAQGALAAAAFALCPTVRRLVLDVSGGGERLERALYDRFGAARGGQTGEPDVRVVFDGAAEAGALCLSPGGIDLCGLRLTSDAHDLPGELERDCLLAALWQAGVLSEGEIAVSDGKNP